MGILRTGKEDSESPDSHRTSAVPGDRSGTISQRHLRLEELFTAHAGRILDYARHRGATLTEAEDIVSEVFVVLTRRLDDAPLASDEVLPWLFGVARKVLGNQVRGARRRQALTQGVGAEAIVAAQRGRDPSAVVGDHLMILQGLGKLRAKDREALLLVTWDGLQYDEAARILGCSPGAVGQRVLRARRLLLEEMGDLRTYRGVESRNLAPTEQNEG